MNYYFYYFLLCKNYAIVFYINNVVRLHLYEFVQLKKGKIFSILAEENVLCTYASQKVY